MRNNDLSKRKLVHGVGLNDADYSVIGHAKQAGKRKIVWRSPFYRAWADMLQRCYSSTAYRTYAGCKVCDEWLTFSNFRTWMETQYWKGKQLDKDLLILGNKVYSPETCVFIGQDLNKFFLNTGKARGLWPLGVRLHSDSKFQSRCDNPFSGKSEHLGYFATPEEAHETWRRKKHEHACKYADMQTDPRIAKALRTRFAVATFSTSNEPEEVCNA